MKKTLAAAGLASALMVGPAVAASTPYFISGQFDGGTGLSGYLDIDPVTGVVSKADVVGDGITFSHIFDSRYDAANDGYTIAISNLSGETLTSHNGDDLVVVVPEVTLQGYAGSYIYSEQNPSPNDLMSGYYTPYVDGNFTNYVFLASGDLVKAPVTAPVSAAPEPSAWALMLTGVAMIGGMLRIGRRRGGVALV